jgi:hypothetical protein
MNMARKDLQMCKKPLREEPMSEATYVEEACRWARELTRREARGPGDLENAWHRLEARYGVPWRTFWALRYRRPECITAYLYERIGHAYRAELSRQMQLYRDELEHTKTKSGTSETLVRAAAALAGEGDDK